MSTRVTDKDIMELIKIRDTLKKYKESLEKTKMNSAAVNLNVNVKEKKDVAVERENLDEESLKNLNKEDLLELLEKLKEIKKEIEKGKQKENGEVKKTSKAKPSKTKSSKSDSKTKSGRKKDEIEEYKKLREKLLNNLRALEKLYSDGIIDEETYKRSRTELKRKISCVDEIILTKIKIDEINSLKDDVIQLLKSRIRGGVFLEEEKQIKEDIKALKSLYEEGIISESEFKEKLNFLQQKLKSKNEIMEEIILIFETWEKRLEERVEVLKQEVEGKKEEYKSKDEAYRKNESIIDKLFSLRKEEKKEISGEVTTPFEKLKEVYTKEKGMYAIGDMVLILKKEIEKRLNCERELTHQELINALKKSDFDKDLKEELIEFFKEVSQKEYTGEISDEEVHAIYERCRAFLERILNIGGKDKQKKPKEEKIKMTKVDVEEKEIVDKLKNVEEEKKKKKKGLIDKINEFFGV